MVFTVASCLVFLNFPFPLYIFVTMLISLFRVCTLISSSFTLCFFFHRLFPKNCCCYISCYSHDKIILPPFSLSRTVLCSYGIQPTWYILQLSFHHFPLSFYYVLQPTWYVLESSFHHFHSAFVSCFIWNKMTWYVYLVLHSAESLLFTYLGCGFRPSFDSFLYFRWQCTAKRIKILWYKSLELSSPIPPPTTPSYKQWRELYRYSS